MKTLILAPLLTVVTISYAVVLPLKALPNPETAAQKAAESWLALVDASKYGASWQQAAQIFKARVTLKQWESTIRPVRTELGQLNNRKLKRASYTKTLPGAPDGEYVVLQYDTVFERRKSALETITPMKEKDGQWRVAGYFIK